MGIFYLKYRDTLPVLQVTLHDPAPAGSLPDVLGPVHDLTGSTGWVLHVYMSDGSTFERDMTKVGADAEGTLKYAWAADDWVTTEPDFLIVGPTLPLAPGEYEHRMEYEVFGSGGERQTFPNDGYDTLRVYMDLGQGS